MYNLTKHRFTDEKQLKKCTEAQERYTEIQMVYLEDTSLNMGSGNLNSGKEVRSPPPYSCCSLVISSARAFWYSGPASARPPAALLFVAYARIESRKRF